MGEQICGHCGLAIQESETGLRHFGHFTAHSEQRCLELLKAQLTEAKAEVERYKAGLSKLTNFEYGELFEDGLAADLHELGIESPAEAYALGIEECVGMIRHKARKLLATHPNKPGAV